ncbi:hypothetical protein [Lysinibacillus sp. FJAT-14745]|nr:hypothetical protein [Lysinibacillus sp. FJAT-14745]
MRKISVPGLRFHADELIAASSANVVAVATLALRFRTDKILLLSLR